MVAFLRVVAVQIAWMLGLFAALSLLGMAASQSPARRSPASPLRVVLFINGTLGDKSFFDSAARGMKQAHETLGIDARVVEGGTDPTRWQSALIDLVDSGDYDLIVAGTYTMVPYVRALAHDYPDARFVLFDAIVDNAACACRNVHSIVFRQNEGAYLAGTLAGDLLRTGLPGLQPHSSLAVVGGMQFPTVEDFIVGFVAGAKAAAPDTPIATQYANSFSDPATGKEIATAQFARGAGIVFHVAGATGQGVNEAALDARRYAIGVDMDQVALYRQSNPHVASRIVTSVLKNVDVAVLTALRQARAGRLAYGQVETLGVAEGGVSLAMNSDVLATAPAAVLQDLQRARDAVVSGRVHVPSAFSAAGGDRP
jgi:basic membrane protein A